MQLPEHPALASRNGDNLAVACARDAFRRRWDDLRHSYEAYVLEDSSDGEARMNEIGRELRSWAKSVSECLYTDLSEPRFRTRETTAGPTEHVLPYIADIIEASLSGGTHGLDVATRSDGPGRHPVLKLPYTLLTTEVSSGMGDILGRGAARRLYTDALRTEMTGPSGYLWNWMANVGKLLDFVNGAMGRRSVDQLHRMVDWANCSESAIMAYRSHVMSVIADPSSEARPDSPAATEALSMVPGNGPMAPAAIGNGPMVFFEGGSWKPGHAGGPYGALVQKSVEAISAAANGGTDAIQVGGLVLQMNHWCDKLREEAVAWRNSLRAEIREWEKGLENLGASHHD